MIQIDYEGMLRQLVQRRHELNKCIAVLEELECNLNRPLHRRGRKSMGEAERKEVGERMKRYWATHRKAKGAVA